MRYIPSVISIIAFSLAPSLATATPLTHAKGDTVILVDTERGLEVIVGPDDISWCHEDDTGLVACGESEQPIGCQYFGEEGPDDLAVCILSTLANLCCSCLAVCDDEGHADPELVIETITAEVNPSTYPSCAWEHGSDVVCFYACDGKIAASCIRSYTGGLWCGVGNGPLVDYGKQPGPCD